MSLRDFMISISLSMFLLEPPTMPRSSKAANSSEIPPCLSFFIKIVVETLYLGVLYLKYKYAPITAIRIPKANHFQ